MNAEEDRGMREGVGIEDSSGLRRGVDVPDRLNRLTQRVIGCAMEVHSTLGPGLLERVYEEALAYELHQAGISASRQVEAPVLCKGVAIGPHRLDMVVEGAVVIELKAVEAVGRLHLAQLVSYLRVAQIPLGLLINFNVPRLKDGVYRRLNDRAFP